MVKIKIRGVGFVILLVMLFSFVSAGVGLKWTQESALVPENTKTCLTYQVYNPWDKDVYAKIRLSEELINITKDQSSEIEFIPAKTSSTNAIPIEFCFKTPRVYDRDCLIGDALICKQTCEEPMKVYEGEVLAIEMTESQVMGGGSGGSATQMSVSAPIRVRVMCVAHDRNWSVVYVGLIVIAGAWFLIRRFSKKKKSKGKKK